MADQPNNYTIGRGKLYFDQFADGTTTRTGERYLGNSPEFSLNQSSEDLDHYSSDEGIRVKDASVTLSQENGGSFTLDSISPENMAMWFLGNKGTVVIASATGLTKVAVVTRGTYVQLGETTAAPQGHGGVTNIVINSPTGVKATGAYTITANPAANDTVVIGGSTITWKASGAVGAQVNIGADITASAAALAAYINANSVALGVTATSALGVVTLKANVGGVAGNAITTTEVGTNTAFGAATLTGGATGPIAALNNWEVDLTTGRLKILDTAVDVADGDTLTITYDTAAQTLSQVIAKGLSIYGALRFISANPVGKKTDYFFPYVKITPDGDFNLKGDDWQSLGFTVDILKLNDTTERIYTTNR